MVTSLTAIFNRLNIIISFMWGRIHPNLDVDLYLPLEEFEDISSAELEKGLSCKLPELDGSYSGKKAYLQCEDFKEPYNVIKVKHREGDYLIRMARHIQDLTSENGHFRQTDGINVTIYIFERR